MLAAQIDRMDKVRDAIRETFPDLCDNGLVTVDTIKKIADIVGNNFGPVQQPWVLEIPFMQQSVLFAAVRAPDGIRKNHPVKVLLRWYRRCVLMSAFENKAMTDPFEGGGGSFTGPFTEEHAAVHFCTDVKRAWPKVRKMYLSHVDELPHHFQLHFMHAAQIIGVHHDNEEIRSWWKEFYLMIVNDAHLHPETDDEMNTRLSDNREEWKRREVVTAV